jgi:hypothetical protein
MGIDGGGRRDLLPFATRLAYNRHECHYTKRPRDSARGQRSQGRAEDGKVAARAQRLVGAADRVREQLGGLTDRLDRKVGVATAALDLEGDPVRYRANRDGLGLRPQLEAGGDADEADEAWRLRCAHDEFGTAEKFFSKSTQTYSQLLVQLPAKPLFLNPDNKCYGKFTIPITLLDQRPDQTWAIKVGTHKVKSRFDGGAEIDVTISPL